MIWLRVKKYWYIFVAAGAFVVYLLTMRNPRKTITDLGSDPSDNPPEPVVAPDFLSNLRDKKKVNDAKIEKMSRSAFIDDINTDYK